MMMSDELQAQRFPQGAEHAPEARTEAPIPAPSMLSAATASFGAGVVQRKLARRVAQRKAAGTAQGATDAGGAHDATPSNPAAAAQLARTGKRIQLPFRSELEP